MEFLKIFITLSICLSFLVITASNAVYSVLYLILVFCVNTTLLLNLGTEFLALIFLIVYVGAIAVLFLFVVMMLNIKNHTTKTNIWDKMETLYYILGNIALLVLVVMLFGGLNGYNNIIGILISITVDVTLPIIMDFLTSIVIDKIISLTYEFICFRDNVENFTLNFKIEHFSFNIDTLFNISLIGFLIYTYFCSYFIIAGIILLQAMIGAIILTMLKHKKIIRQNIFSQVSRKSSNAVFLTEIKK